MAARDRCCPVPRWPARSGSFANLKRLDELLAEFCEHPLLTQLAAICHRVLALPLTAPLKQALTGLELLLARAQLWEETAAQYVSIKTQLAAVAALATRWRRLELASWRNLLRQVATRHAAGASRSWFHLHTLFSAAAVADEADTAAVAAAAAAVAGGAPPAPAPEGQASHYAQPALAAGMSYRQVAATLEAFIQTSTLGEFCARLDLLHGFSCQLQVCGGGLEVARGPGDRGQPGC